MEVAVSPRDILDVCLEDSDRRTELALLTDLMIAANEVDGPMAQEDIDWLLQHSR